MNILIFFIILLVLVLVHEFGHFFAAKRFGIRVDEFGFGFPPKLFGKKFGETEYTFNLLPLGGFVKIFGENPTEENTSGPDSERSMINKPAWKQAIVLFAGVAANFLLAWLLFSFSFMSGLPASVSNAPEGYVISNAELMIISTLPESPAEVAGLKSGDRVISVQTVSGDQSLTEINPDTLRTFILANANEEIEIGYKRGKSEQGVASVIPVIGDNGSPAIGISMDLVGIVKVPFFKALWEGLKFNWAVTSATAVGLYTLITEGLQGKGDMSAITGPVGLVGIVGDAYEFGFSYLLSFTALISVNLAIINLAPFPALDGGRLLFLLIEKIKGSRLNPAFANAANMVGFAILIILMLFVTYNDILNLI
ncbi:MAG TPA: RIP metalloprotease RseP [Candidatus Paceibacterota bacterium]|nr:RIP metalloprotease RseP [Candidatus Paceibacterota bacterium]